MPIPPVQRVVQANGPCKSSLYIFFAACKLSICNWEILHGQENPRDRAIPSISNGAWMTEENYNREDIERWLSERLVWLLDGYISIYFWIPKSPKIISKQNSAHAISDLFLSQWFNLYRYSGGPFSIVLCILLLPIISPLLLVNIPVIVGHYPPWLYCRL